MVPDDVSVVSVDDDVIATWLRPPLTTVALPHYDLGREVIKVLRETTRTRSGAPADPTVPHPDVRSRARIATSHYEAPARATQAPEFTRRAARQRV